MNNLHSINKLLPDEIIAQIWALRTKSYYYKDHMYTRVYMDSYDPNNMKSKSPILVSRDSSFLEPYNWVWESARLRQWRDENKPTIDMSKVEVIYGEKKPLGY